MECIKSVGRVQDLLTSRMSETEIALMVQSVEMHNGFKYVNAIRLGAETRV